MAHLRDTFTTMNHCQYTWPYPMPILIKPSQPPVRTGIRSYPKDIDPDDCKCDGQDSLSDMSRYKELAEKECRLRNEIFQVNCEMSNLVTSLLDNSALEDETMRSVYQIDYEKRGIPIAKYRTLMAATDSPVGSPIRPVLTELRDGYREPARFRNSAIVRPTIEPASSVNFQRRSWISHLTSPQISELDVFCHGLKDYKEAPSAHFWHRPKMGGQSFVVIVPETCLTWQEPNTGQSEYVNGTSKLGLTNMNSRQQYLEPQPSSRRRRGGP